MTKPLRCYVLRAEDGQLYCGAHPYDTREEAARARDGMFGDGLGVPEVVELAEVVRCAECKRRYSRFCSADGPTDSDWFCSDGESQ